MRDEDLFRALGFRWDRQAVPTHAPAYSVERACFRFHKMMAEYVWDASMLEGNPFTFPEVQTLLEGITVGGRKITDQEQVLNLAESSRRLLAMVKARAFSFHKAVFSELNGIVARNESLEWGVFRGEGRERAFTPDVALGQHGRYTPLPTTEGAPLLNKIYSTGVDHLQACPPFERSAAFFLFGALQQFFFDGNKRTSRLMMNGILMSHGMDAISVPAAKAQSFNEKMVRFYLSKDGTEMMDFLASCHPDAAVLARRAETHSRQADDEDPYAGPSL